MRGMSVGRLLCLNTSGAAAAPQPPGGFGTLFSDEAHRRRSTITLSADPGGQASGQKSSYLCEHGNGPSKGETSRRIRACYSKPPSSMRSR